MYRWEGSDQYTASWMDHDDVRRWLKEELFVGSVLNFPCGYSDLGDLRIDQDPDVDPDHVLDLEDAPWDLPRFDTVYCDPPYGMYDTTSRDWVKALWDLARERLILQTPLHAIHLPSALKSWYIAESKPGSSGNRVTAFQVFDRPDAELGDFGIGDEVGGGSE